MAKKFNIVGKCHSTKHYMANVSRKLAKMQTMVEEGDYFVINRPRQYGKTTTLYALADLHTKSGEYIVLNTSFESIDENTFKETKMLVPELILQWAKYAGVYAPDLSPWLLEESTKITTLERLSDMITLMAHKTDKKVVLMIDEVDKSSNNQLFISFLGMLRSKYLENDIFKTFHSVILAGVHDVKSLKLKIRAGEEQKYNSPWNIAANFDVDMNLQPFEIIPMLEDYVAETGIKMDTAAMAEDLFYYTSGYPFLVSRLCKIMAEEMPHIQETKEWTEKDLEWAVRKLILESNTNSDSLTKNLENNPDLYKIVYRILIEGDYNDYNVHDPIISMGLMYGIFRNGHGVSIHNKIYEEVIYRYMTSKTKTHLGTSLTNHTIGQNFKLANNTLNMELALLKFQMYMHEQYSKHDRDFLERHGRLVYLAFMRPILNGHGYDFKEPQVSEERRLDVIITFYQHKYVAELKIWRGPVAHEKGLNQLADYLDRLNLKEGYLIIFDHKEIKTWESGWINHNGKRIFIVWV